MQYFEQNNLSEKTILTELSGGNAELGEAFALALNDMVVQAGITNPKAYPFEITNKSWKSLAQKENKTNDEIKKLDEEFFKSINLLSKSYLLFIAKNTQNRTGKINYIEYEKYLLKYRFGRYDVMKRPDYLKKVKAQIKNAFDKISAHGENSGDDIIDKDDMAAFIYALSVKSKHDENNKFCGFTINGDIEPENYAVCENLLFEADDNLFSIKLRTAYKILHGQL